MFAGINIKFWEKGGMMAFSVDELGNISLTQGDSGTIVVEGLNTDKNYTVYFGIKDKNRNSVADELYVSSNKNDSVTFVLNAEYTDLLTVDKNNPYEIYYYGIKACYEDDNYEDTLVVSDGDIGDMNAIIVYPKKVEGTQDE